MEAGVGSAGLESEGESPVGRRRAALERHAGQDARERAGGAGKGLADAGACRARGEGAVGEDMREAKAYGLVRGRYIDMVECEERAGRGERPNRKGGDER